MATDNTTAMQFQKLQNIDENINIDSQNTENDSQNIWTKNLTDQPVFPIKEINNHCRKGMVRDFGRRLKSER